MEKADVWTDVFDEVEIRGRKALFTEQRIDPENVPEGLHYYMLRHGDDDSYPCTMEKKVAVNYFGTVFVKEPFAMKKDYLSLDADDFYYTGEQMQIYSFMGKEPDVVGNADSLLAFQRQHEPELGLTKEEAELLLGYLEGHDYCIGVMNGKLFRGDLDGTENGILWEPYPLDDVIEICCDWNFDLILEEEARTVPDEKDRARYAAYKADEVKLDRLFDRTGHGKEMEALAGQMADAIIAEFREKNFHDSQEVQKSVEAAADTVVQKRTESRGGR